MKKYLVLLLLLITVLTLVIPSPAFAHNERHTQAAFTATAQVAVIDPGNPLPRYLTPWYIMVNTTGEQVYGTIVSANGWDIAGFGILFQHQSKTFINLKTMTIAGTATGKITVFDRSGAPVMQGSYSALIRGTVAFDATGALIYNTINDRATFSLSGYDATAFEDVRANGFGFADLNWIGYTLAGPMTLTGNYRTAD